MQILSNWRQQATLTTGSIVFYINLMFVLFVSLPMCQSLCGCVGLFPIHLKFLKTRCYEVASDP